MRLHNKLKEYEGADIYPFHMPGHKRNKAYLGDILPYQLDITEIGDFDDLHHAESIIKKMEQKASELFKSDTTYCLVNGSTVGNIAAILGVTNYGDKIIVARNCHKSIHSAMELNNIDPIYIYPDTIEEYGICGVIDSKEVERLIRAEKDIKAVVIVSPTYEGVISNISEIAEIAHKYNIPLIVDEAHGAHLYIDNYFPKNSNQQGADIVIHSIHKTLPAPTQTALLHINGNLVDKKRVKKYLSMLQSSSPSYILMAGISRCIELLEEENIQEVVSEYVENIEYCRMKLKGMQKLKLVETPTYDKGKIVISTLDAPISSNELLHEVRSNYGIEMEMDGFSYVIAMTSIADTREAIEKLTYALLDIDNSLTNKNVHLDFLKNSNGIKGQEELYLEQKEFHQEMQKRECQISNVNIPKTIAEIFVEEGHKKMTTGKISESYYYLYPPGIPLIVPGEPITDRHNILMEALKKRNYTIRKC